MTPEELKKDCDIFRERLAERFAQMEHRLTTLEITLWGQDGSNGIKGTLNELKRKMDMLLRFFWGASAAPAITIALLAILKFLEII
jgi:hypothetical protein